MRCVLYGDNVGSTSVFKDLKAFFFFACVSFAENFISVKKTDSFFSFNKPIGRLHSLRHFKISLYLHVKFLYTTIVVALRTSYLPPLCCRVDVVCSFSDSMLKCWVSFQTLFYERDLIGWKSNGHQRSKQSCSDKIKRIQIIFCTAWSFIFYLNFLKWLIDGFCLCFVGCCGTIKHPLVLKGLQ